MLNPYYRQIFNAILGWNNTATIGTIVSYCLYWIFVAAFLVYMNWKEKRRALAKLQNGEWDKDGDEALEDAKEFVDKDGVFVGKQTDDAAMSSIKRAPTKGARLEVIEMTGPSIKNHSF